MNIIELFEKLNLDKTDSIRFTPEEIIRIEKKINIEKRINSEIDINVASNLIEAIKNYPNEFYFFTNHCNLYNFFANTNYDEDHFKEVYFNISNENIKVFVDHFLKDDLLLFFDQQLSNNQFNQMNDMLLFKKYFPETILFKIAKKAIGKVETGLQLISHKSNDVSQLNFIRQRGFYIFLSHFNSIEMDEKLKLLLNEIVDGYNKDKKSEFFSAVIMAMYNYDAFDEDFAETLEKNRNAVSANQNRTTNSKISWRPFAIILLILIRVLYSANKCSSNSSTTNSYDYFNNNKVAQIIDSISDKSKQDKIDFFDYLTDIDSITYKQLVPTNEMQTGQNPFETIYSEQVAQQDTIQALITVKNSSNFDVIVLKNSQLNTNSMVPKIAYFIKRGDSIKVNSDGYFNFYFGENLASFETKGDAKFHKKNSKPEYRFLKQLSNSKQILEKEFIVQKDILLTNERQTIKISSNFLYCNNDSINKSVDEYVFK